MKKKANVAASVHALLLNRAKAEEKPFNEMLQYYAMERFLYRLSRSEHAGDFVLKGGLMFRLWGGPTSRATKDIDLLGRTRGSVSRMVDVMKACLEVSVEDDGLFLTPGQVTGEPIRLEAKYDGVRVRCGRLSWSCGRNAF